MVIRELHPLFRELFDRTPRPSGDTGDTAGESGGSDPAGSAPESDNRPPASCPRRASTEREGIGLAAWDAQVRIELADHRRIAKSTTPLLHEQAILEELAELTAEYCENGPWRAAKTLFDEA